MPVAVDTPTGAAYDLVLLAHIVVAALSAVVVAVAVGQALALRRGGDLTEEVRRYYSGKVNWAGRLVHLLPLTGLALVGMSRSAYALSQLWIVLGLVSWLAISAVLEAISWPAERRAAAVLDDEAARGALARRALLGLWIAGLLLLATTVLMVAQPGT